MHLFPEDILQHTLHFARSNIRNIACVNIRLSIACRASHLRSIIVWEPLMATLYPTLYRHRLIHLYFYVCKIVCSNLRSFRSHANRHGICTTWRILSHWDNLPACPTYMVCMNASYMNNVNVCATCRLLISSRYDRLSVSTFLNPNMSAPQTAWSYDQGCVGEPMREPYLLGPGGLETGSFPVPSEMESK